MNRVKLIMAKENRKDNNNNNQNISKRLSNIEWNLKKILRYLNLNS